MPKQYLNLVLVQFCSQASSFVFPLHRLAQLVAELTNFIVHLVAAHHVILRQFFTI